MSASVKSPVGRKKTNYEQMPARFPKGTFERIEDLLEPTETRSDFLRCSVEAEIRKRQQSLMAEIGGK